ANVALVACIVVVITLPATTEIYTLSLHDALPISDAVRPTDLEVMPAETPEAAGRVARSVRHTSGRRATGTADGRPRDRSPPRPRSEEHTSELQSRSDLVCRLLLEKKKTALNNMRR